MARGKTPRGPRLPLLNTSSSAAIAWTLRPSRLEACSWPPPGGAAMAPPRSACWLRLAALLVGERLQQHGGPRIGAERTLAVFTQPDRPQAARKPGRLLPAAPGGPVLSSRGPASPLGLALTNSRPPPAPSLAGLLATAAQPLVPGKCTQCEPRRGPQLWYFASLHCSGRTAHGRVPAFFPGPMDSRPRLTEREILRPLAAPPLRRLSCGRRLSPAADRRALRPSSTLQRSGPLACSLARGTGLKR